MKDIAHRMCVSTGAVDTYRRRAFQKLGVSTLVAATLALQARSLSENSYK